MASNSAHLRARTVRLSGHPSGNPDKLCVALIAIPKIHTRDYRANDLHELAACRPFSTLREGSDTPAII